MPESVGNADGVESAVCDTLGVWDGVAVGELVVFADGLGVGEAKAKLWPGKQTMSTTGGHVPAMQLQAPYSVLPTHEPGPVHEILQWSGVDGRVQYMTAFEQDSTPEQFTTAPSCKMRRLFPGVAEQLCGV